MKLCIYDLRFTIYVLLVFLAASARAELPVTTNASFVRFASSYDTSQLHLYGDYLDSALYLYFPKLNIHAIGASRSGGSTEEANTNRLEKYGLALWANGSQAWGIIPTDDNADYSSNAQFLQLSNTFTAPTNLYNGVAFTNEHGWAGTNTVHWISIGAIPGNSAGGDLTELSRNNAATNAAAIFNAFMGVEMWNTLYLGGWSNDFASGANLIGWFPQSHPGAPGMLDMALVIATNWLDTNIDTCTLNWNAGTVSATNHCVVTNASRTGDTFTFNWKADRHSMAWDVPDGTTTNNALPGFQVIPRLTNAFFEVIQITNLPAGTYNVNLDGSNILSVSSDQLAGGLNLFMVTNGSIWAQRKEVLGRIRDRNHCDRISLVDGSAGDQQGNVSYESFAQGFWNEGHRGDTLISDLSVRIANLNSFDVLIHSAATPTNHTFSITKTPPRFAPFHK